MEKMIFSEKQPRIKTSANGKVLLLLHGRELQALDTDNGACWEYDTEWIDTGGMTSEASLVNAAKAKVLSDIDSYDKGAEVNGFIVDGERAWLDKATRVGLMNSATIAKNGGQKTVPLWLNGKSYTVDCEKLIKILSAIEMYALLCYNRTAEHKSSVEELDNVEDICGYDFRSNYPDTLEFSL